MGTLGSLISQTMPERFKKAFDQRHPENAPPKPEEKPYTFWERIGAMPVAESRLRQRQYYYPHTDFRDYTYDEASPEEQELRAKWLSRMFDVSWHWPMIYFTTSFTCCLPLPPIYRTPAVVCCALTSIFLEGMRVYVNAGHEREMLDDFIVAKEFWYIKNVEALELGLVAKPKMTDEQKERKYIERQTKEAEELSKLAMYAKENPEMQKQLMEEQQRRFMAETGGGGGAAAAYVSGGDYGSGKHGSGGGMMPDPVQGLMAGAPGVPQGFAAGGNQFAGNMSSSSAGGGGGQSYSSSFGVGGGFGGGGGGGGAFGRPSAGGGALGGMM